jgi:aminopeptidase
MENMLKKYADLIVDYCLSVKANQKVYIISTLLAEPLVKEVYRAVIIRGAHVDIKFVMAEESKIFFDHANEEQLNHENPLTKIIYATYDAYLYIRAPYNLKEDQNIDRKKSAVRGKANAPLNKIYNERTASGDMRRCLCQYPTQASAQEAGMSLEEYADFIFSSCKLYDENPMESWMALGRSQQKIVDYLNTADKIQYLNNKTNISFSVKDRIWINSDGKANMPSGEVFSAPIEESVNGFVHFDYPAIFSGKEVSGISLWVENGLVTKWEAAIGQDLLDEVFKIDGARIFGEVAVGTNYGITRATKNILFDEKIGGSIHMAVGQSYIQNRGKNESPIHWDMIADMRQGGKIFADGRLIYENGYFLEELAL